MTKKEMRKYKGMVWGIIPEEVKDVILNVDSQEKIKAFIGDGFKNIKINEFYSESAYWHEDLDKLEGEELVGQWCKCRNKKTEEYRVVTKVRSYNPDKPGFPYETLHEIFEDAVALPEELQKLLDEEIPYEASIQQD